MPDAGSTAPRQSSANGPRDIGGAICKVLPIAPSTCHHRQAVAQYLSKASLRAQRDAELCPRIKEHWEASGKRYGAVKVWYDLVAQGEGVARCTVVRLMKEMGIQGVIRGKGKKTTYRDPALPCPEDKVNRDFKAPAPNVLRGEAGRAGRPGDGPPAERFHLCADRRWLYLRCLHHRKHPVTDAVTRP